jgi:hypothetical protein
MTMPGPDDDDPFAQPPDWVPLPDLARWLERHFKLPGSAAELTREIIRGIRTIALTYRVQDFPGIVGEGLPPGFESASDPWRIIVTDWDLVAPDWKRGTVAAPSRWEDRYVISVWWPRAARWAEPFASDIRRRRAKKALPAVAGLASAAMPPAPQETQEEAVPAAPPPKIDWPTYVNKNGGVRDRAIERWLLSHWTRDNMPGRDPLFVTFRAEFQNIKGVNQRTIAAIASTLKSDEAKKGGAPTHRARA